MEDYLLEECDKLSYQVEELEDKIERIKEVLDQDVYLGTIGNSIKYQILDIIEPQEKDKQLTLKGWSDKEC